MTEYNKFLRPGEILIKEPKEPPRWHVGQAVRFIGVDHSFNPGERHLATGFIYALFGSERPDWSHARTEAKGANNINFYRSVLTLGYASAIPLDCIDDSNTVIGKWRKRQEQELQYAKGGY